MNHQSQLSISEAYGLYSRFLHENPKIRSEEGYIHVSDVVNVGWECSRFLGYIRFVEKRINATETFSPDLRRTFWVGEGFEEAAAVSMEKAVRYSIEVKGGELYHFQHQTYVELPEYGLKGNIDFVIEYKLGDTVFFHVVDAKSTSSTAQTKRQVGRDTTRSVAEPGYDRQVSAYVAMAQELGLAKHEDAVYVGSLFYLEKQFPHRFSDAPATGDRVLKLIKRKIKAVDAGVVEGRLPLPQRGAHCARCPWSELCLGEK